MKRLLLLSALLTLAAAVPASARLDAWGRQWMKPMDTAENPPSQAETALGLRAAPGEYEPACFAVRADRDTKVKVEFNDVDRGAVLPGGWVRIRRVDPMADTLEPKRLHEFSGPVELKKDLTQFFWVTVRPPAGTAPGVYSGRIALESPAGSRELAIECEVLPFELEESPIRAGAFMCLVDLPPGWYDDMAEHGFDAIQFFTWEWGIRGRGELDQNRWWALDAIKLGRRGDELTVDFTVLDRIMADFNEAGMQGPFVISLGNDHHLFYERAIAELFGMPIDTSEVIAGKPVIAPPVTPELDSLFVDGLRQIRDHWEEMEYAQELVVLIYDEPTERLLERCKNRYDLLKTVMPDYRVYGVVMNRRELAESMLDQMDIIVCNGDFLRIRTLAEEYGKGYWVYGFPLRTVAGSRYDLGCFPWRLGAEGVFFWQYNYWFYSPDYCAVYRDPVNPAELVSSTHWEAMREGTDDLRYFATAEKLIESAPTGMKEEMAARLEDVRERLEPGRFRQVYPEGEDHDEMTVLDSYYIPQKARDLVIGMILEMLGR